MIVNIQDILQKLKEQDRFEERMRTLESQSGSFYTKNIRDVISKSVENIQNQIKSFVIFGEPQSGKTEMMIALTCKLLDLRYRFVVVLVNDNVELLNQNLGRFVGAQLNPTPLEFTEIIDTDIDIDNGQWVIFCKKNSKNLHKLLSRLKKYPNKVIVDDEADYASPNSKINKNERNAINSLITDLLGNDGLYIGVTATPARIDLNNAFNNDNTKWIYFEPHPEYTGQKKFFPPDINDTGKLPYTLKILPDTGDTASILEDAVIRFLVNVSYLNSFKNQTEINYSMLVHTSGKTADHRIDYHIIQKIIGNLKIQNLDDKKFNRNVEKITKFIANKFPGCENEIISYLLKKIGASKIVVMNCDTDRNVVDNSLGTNPKTPFTFAIGGNVVSRGVTFNNLLSMFFTRDSKHKIQQDTYIQRARMFGNRNKYLEYFELAIPEELFSKWHQCFVFHALSLQAIVNNQKPPIWFEDSRISAVAKSSIDKLNVDLNTGEMVTAITDKVSQLEDIVNSKDSALIKLERINTEVSEEVAPKYLIEFIKNNLPYGNDSIAWYHEVRDVKKDSKDQDYYSMLHRKKGVFGGAEIKKMKEENNKASHFFIVVKNDIGFARLVYKNESRIRTIKHKR